MPNDTVSRPIRFSSDDCAVFARHANTGSWTNVPPPDQVLLRDVRLRLRALASEALARVPGTIGLVPFVSILNPNGRVPKDMWNCVYPEDVPNKSFGLQAALILSPTGAEMCFCLGSGSAQVQNLRDRDTFREALLRTQAGLRAVEMATWQQVLASLGDGWTLRRSWRQPSTRADFDSLDAWTRFASSTGGTGATISRNLSVDELDALGGGIEVLFTDLVRAVTPVFESIYGTTNDIAVAATASERFTRSENDRLIPSLRVRLLEAYQELLAAGKLPSHDQLASYYDSFRLRFQPSNLAHLDGDDLLETMHNQSNKGSLVHWLEFKADEEFPPIFGSIAGGSPWKFGVYKRKDTGAWMTGSALTQREVSHADATRIAREHRRQLAAGERLFRQLSEDATDSDYSEVQREVEQAAPDLWDLAWSHKYWSLLFPTKLDDFHTEESQRFHLLKLLQLPPDTRGRFAIAGRFTALARELELPLKHLTILLQHVNGPRYRYWRVGTSDGTSERRHWQEMVNRGVIAIGWSALGSLASSIATDDLKEVVRTGLSRHYPSDPRAIGRLAQQIFNFCRLERNDIIVAANGATVLGIGRIKDDYQYDSRFDFPHARPVEWLELDEWRLPHDKEGLRSTVFELKQYPENLLALERRLLAPLAPPAAQPSRIESTTLVITPTRGVAVTDVPELGEPGERVRRILLRKSQAILHGPPGTGKTFWAEHVARHIASWTTFGADFAQLNESERGIIVGTQSASGLVRMCTFHPGYGYEDFIEGYRPEEADGNLRFRRRDGIFKRLCDDARRTPERTHILIIDEINRGDLPRIFGELLTVIERSRRGSAVELSLTGERFVVPANVLLIGTMNTADRSIALVDAALRRRFGFVELLPDTAALRTARTGRLPLAAWLEALNRRIVEHTGRDARSLQVGHAYLMPSGTPVQDLAEFAQVLQEDIFPLLQEYCYDDWYMLERILGKALVNADRRRIQSELFDASRRDDLVQALLAMDVDMTTSVEAMNADDTDLQADDTDLVDDDDEQDG